MREQIHSLIRSRFARNVAIVATGTAGAQAITMAFSPVITRLYGPEAFGLLGVFMALVAILAPVAALTYPTAIVLPKEDSDAIGIARLSLILAFLISLLVAAILILAGDPLLQLLGSEAIASFMLLIPVAMFFLALLQIIQQWLIRKKQFKITAKVAVVQALIVNSAKTGLGWINPSAAMLIIIATMGAVIHSGMLALGIKKAETAHAKNQSNIPACTIRDLARRHYDFPAFRAPQVFINAVSQSLPVLMLASYFGPAAAGFYAISKMALGVPVTLIGKSVADVFYPKITEAAHNNENLSHHIIKATAALALVGVIPFALIIILGPWLFGFIFGADWIRAGEYARWLAMWFMLGFLNRPSVAAIPVLGMQKIFLIYEIVSVLARVLALLAGVLFFQDDLIAVALFSIAGVILNAGLIAFTVKNSRRSATRYS